MVEFQPVDAHDDKGWPAPPLRLKKRHEFLRAAGGRKLHAALLSIHAAPRSGEPGEAPRVGFTITKKVGGAVERNRIRRRLKDVMRTVPDLCMKPSHDYVIVARQGLLTASHGEIVAGVRTAIYRVHAAPGRGRPSRPKSRRDERIVD